MKHIIYLLLTIASLAHADDSELYCNYLTEKAQGETATMVMPDAVARLSQAEINKNSNVIIGLQQDLAKYFKASSVKDLAKKECEMYTASQKKDDNVHYAMTYIRKTVIEYQLIKIDEAILKVRAMLAQNEKLVNSGNMTIVDDQHLNTAYHKLTQQKEAFNVELKTLSLPAGYEIKNSIYNVYTQMMAVKQAENNVSNADNWGVQLTVGANQNLDTQNTGAYIGVQARYNLGDYSKRNHLQKASESYVEWQKQKDSKYNNTATYLIGELESLKVIQQNKLKDFIQERSKLDENLNIVSKFDTEEAIAFKNQLDMTYIENDLNIYMSQKYIQIIENSLHELGA